MSFFLQAIFNIFFDVFIGLALIRVVVVLLMIRL